MFDGIDDLQQADVVLHHGDYREMLSHVVADLIFTSPPYNIGTSGPRRDGCRKDGHYDPKSFAGVDGYADSMSVPDYIEDQRKFVKWGISHLAVNGTMVYNHKPIRRNKRLIHPLLWINQVEDAVLTEEIVWDRGSGHNHDRTQMWPQTERLYVLRRADGGYCLNDNTTAKGLPQQRDIWKIGRTGNNLGHCASFPVALAEAVILAWSKPGQLVVDPYSGSGTTALAAKNLDRKFEGAEILPKYHSIAMERIQ